MHNHFRGDRHAYQNAIEAIDNAHEAGLVTAVALCAVKYFVTMENLSRYMDLAHHLGVSFVQFIEPRAKGRYAHQDVELGEEKLSIREAEIEKIQREVR